MTSHRELFLRASAAIWGTAIGIALLPVWTRPAQPGQLPGAATALNLDAGAPMRFVGALVLLPIILPVVLQPLIRRLARGRRWAAICAATAMFAALWISLIDQNVPWAVVPTAIVVCGCTLLRDFDARFTRRDVILMPVTLAVLLALIDLAKTMGIDKQFLVAAFVVLAIRLTIAFIPSPLDPALAFVASPLGLVFETPFLSYDQQHFGWPALLVATITPFLARPLLRNSRRTLLVIAWAVYPLSVYSYATATSLLAAEGKPRVNFFEDAHALVPASEMLRGERPYRDILPAHGLIEDGLLDYASMRMHGTSAGVALKSRAVVGALNAVAIYALGAALTGSPEAGVLAFLFGVAFGIVGSTFRTVPHLFALALMAAALRLRRARLLGYAGFGVIGCVMTSLDFGAYTALTLVVAVLCFGKERVRAARAAAVGLLAGIVPLFAAFALLGIAGDFVRQTFFELRTFGPPAALTPFAAPAAFKTLRFFPDIVGGIFEKSAALMLFWVGATILAGVTLTMRGSRRVLPLTILSFWISVAGASYAARHHLHFQFAVAPLLVGGTWALYRAGSRIAVFAAAVLLAISGFTTHLLVVSMVRHAHGPLDQNVVEIGDVPRARGALFNIGDAATIGNAKLFVDRHLGAGDTFFDFTNRPMLYFLLNRDCPIRDLGPAWYEPESRQREVIAALARNPHVRAALIDPNSGLDGVPNEVRAPLVWAWLQQHFEPQPPAGNLVFWIRK